MQAKFKGKFKREDRMAIRVWLGDSRVWMRVAIELAKEDPVGSGNHSELNVAHVCAGFALELALKALTKSEGREVTPKHGGRRLYDGLSKGSRLAIRRSTKLDIDLVLQLLDDCLGHPDRKYWMFDTKFDPKPVTFMHHFIGGMFAELHAKIVDMACDNAFENWAELDSQDPVRESVDLVQSRSN